MSFATRGIDPKTRKEAEILSAEIEKTNAILEYIAIMADADLMDETESIEEGQNE